jgi:DNA helicase-2/ATP-dependent DNA helicase PcrA
MSPHPEREQEADRLERTREEIDAFVRDRLHHPDAGGDEWANLAIDRHDRELIEIYGGQRNDPYFGRLVFHPVPDDQPDDIYLGYQVLGLGRYEVIDWRAPVARLFYGSSAENQSYKAPMGRMDVRLLLRRHFKIGEDDWIKDEFDHRTRETAAIIPSVFTSREAILLQELYSRGDPRLQDIVRTIEEQQDVIIRAPHDRVVVINGVAGSGKTSIALHRLAYLLYPAADTNIHASRTIIFCPNPIFLHYVEDLLPRLGERNVQQVTFANWALSQMGLNTDKDKQKHYKVVDSVQEEFLDSRSDFDTLNTREQHARLKGDLRIKKLLENYVVYLKWDQQVHHSINEYSDVSGQELEFVFSPDEIWTAIEISKGSSSDPIMKMRDAALAALQGLIPKKYEEAVARKVSSLNAFAEALEQKAAEVDNPVEKQVLHEKARSILSAAGQLPGYAFSTRIPQQRTTSQISEGLKKDFQRVWPTINLVKDYYSLFQDQTLLHLLADGIYTKEEVLLLRDLGDKGQIIEMEDLPSLFYFYKLVSGHQGVRYDHIVVDEVQDFSPLQLEIIYTQSNKDSMTLVGDIAQGIHAYRGIGSWDELTSIISPDRQSLENITQSYRSTHELVTLANEVLGQVLGEDALLAEPFDRHGNLPTIVHVEHAKDMTIELMDRIKDLQGREDGYKNIAVILKDTVKAKALISSLVLAGVAPVVTTSQLDGEFKYTGGLVVLPVTLTKGLEFEAVVLYDVNEIEYSSVKPYDGRLLYVGITRALHELCILYSGELSSYLTSIEGKASFEEVTYDEGE